jgi:sarcosine oxidase subunit gamma
MITKESPLQGIKLGNAATIAMRELPVLPAIDLRVAPASPAQTAVAEALGITLPAKPGQSTTSTNSGGEVHALCLAPDWWLLTGYPEAKQKLATLEDHHFSIVEVSGQRTTIELEGPNVREVLAHLWEQDLREKSFPVGSVSQGLMVKAPVILFHIAPFRYWLMVRSSFAVHLWTALADAAVEWV